MLQTWPTSPVTEAFAKVLEVFHTGKIARKRPEDGKEYFIVSYREDFDFLWQLDKALLGWLEGVSRTIVLVWDETPRKGSVGLVNIADYVTAFDWAVALSLVDKTQHEDNATLPWRLLIFDLASEQHAGSETVQIFRRIQQGNSPILPWISVYSPTGTSELLLRVLQMDPASYPQASDLDLLRRLWAGALARPANPRDRHAIANLVGPQMLLANMRDRNVVPRTEINGNVGILRALERLMEAVGLVPEAGEQEPGPWFPPEKWRDYVDSFVLLDDMHDVGWGAFLKRALGISADKTLRIRDKPDSADFGKNGTQALINLLTDENGRLRIGQGLPLFDSHKEMLFLDLRLFIRRPVDQEIAFFERLLELAQAAPRSRGDLPWPGFAPEEIQAVERCIKTRKVESEDYFVALTLLPRLIALVDPMLPIVLFSSTGQKRIIDALHAYGNIILDFDKPRFFGEPGGDVIGGVRVRFERALGRALCLLKGRMAYQKLKADCCEPEHSVSVADEKPYVEIYVDESRKVEEKEFRVGGLAIIYQSEDDAAEFNKGMLDELIWGPTDLEPNPFRVTLQKELGPWEKYQSTVFGPIAKMLNDMGARPVGFCLVRPPEIRWDRDALDLASPWCLDNLYRNLVLQALEVLLFEVIPQHLRTRQFRCGVYLATRARTESDEDDPEMWDKLPYRYGVRVFEEGGSRWFWSIQSDSVHPIVAEIRALDHDQNLQVVAARGGRLFYGKRELYKEMLPRPAHFIADPVIRFCKNDGALRGQHSLGKWLERGFVSVADHHFHSLLEACRHARAGRYVDALLAAAKASRVEQWAKPRIAESLNSLSGSDFIEFCDRLPRLITGLPGAIAP